MRSRGRRKTIRIQHAVILMLLIGLASSHLYVRKQRQLDKIRTDAAYNRLWKKYDWKTKRLRIYTELVYTKLYNNK